MKKIYAILFASLLCVSLNSAQDLPEIEVLTWTEDISIGDSFQWNVNKFALNGTTVTDYGDYGVKEGSLITLTVDVQLSEVNIAPIVNQGLDIPDVNDYVTIDVDGTERNLTVFHPGMLILPTELTLANDGGHFNSLFAAYLNNAVFFSADNSFSQVSCEYTEFNSTVIEETFVWDVYLGVLKSINIHWEEDLELDVSVVNPDQFCVPETPSSSSLSDPVSSPTRGNGDDSPLGLFAIVTALFILPLMRKKFRKS